MKRNFFTTILILAITLQLSFAEKHEITNGVLEELHNDGVTEFPIPGDGVSRVELERMLNEDSVLYELPDGVERFKDDIAIVASNAFHQDLGR